MTQKLVRFDETLRVRAELDQAGILRTAHNLLSAIDAAIAADPAWEVKLRTLKLYAAEGAAGQIKSPRTWSDEPLRYEYREDLLPCNVLEAYGAYAFLTHGLTRTPPIVQYHKGVAYIEVNE